MAHLLILLQVEVLVMEKHESSMSRRMTLPSEKRASSMGPTVGSVGSFGRQNLASVIEHHGSGRKSLSETLLVDSKLRKLQVDDDAAMKPARNFEDERKPSAEETSSWWNLKKKQKKTKKTKKIEMTITSHSKKPMGNQGFFTGSSSIHQSYEIQMAALIRKNGILKGQLAAAVAGREAAEKNLSLVIKSRQEVEKRLNDTLKEMELMKEKLVLVEMAQEEANSLSNIVHSNHVRLEHDVAFLKAVLDDT
ncbi:hypothetical protein Hanom_Chr00s001823g01688101 [Helianthus anomalus]